MMMGVQMKPKWWCEVLNMIYEHDKEGHARQLELWGRCCDRRGQADETWILIMSEVLSGKK